MGGAVSPPCCLPGQTMVEVTKVMMTSFKRSHASCYTQCPQPCSRLPPTQASARHSWTVTGKSGSVLCGGHCSFLLGPGAQASVCALQESIWQSCVSSGSSVVVLMETSSKRSYAIPRSAAPRGPVPVAVHCWPAPPQETLKHRFVSMSKNILFCGHHFSLDTCYEM